MSGECNYCDGLHSEGSCPHYKNELEFYFSQIEGLMGPYALEGSHNQFVWDFIRDMARMGFAEYEKEEQEEQ